MARDNSPEQHENTVVFLVAPGDMLDGRWLIESRIGQGAMGSVFKGKDTKQNRSVAIKILAPEHCRKPKVLARFEREARLMTTLRHPNIIQLFGLGRRGALPYIVMQYLEGMTLYDVLKRKGGKLTPGETMAIVKQIAAGLAFVHRNGLVHRDIKPQNIYVGPGGRVTILDLGVVRDKSNPGLTKPGAMVGTPYYMSPEQIAGTEEIDKRTDVYALAAMTYELLVGKPPFLGSSNFEVLYAHKTQPAPDASQFAKGVSKDAGKALQRGMAKKRDDRPQSTSEFYADLEAYFGSAEKVDPAVAFAFLEEEAQKARQKEAEKKVERERRKMVTVPSTPVVKVVKPPGATSSSSEVPMASSVDVESLDEPGTEPGLKPQRAPVKLTTGSRASLVPVPKKQNDTLAGAGETEAVTDAGVKQRVQNLDSRPTDLKRGGTGAMPAHDTGEVPTGVNELASASDTGEDEPPEPEAEEASETGGADQTMTEGGELRVVTTVKGLTSSCALFIDGTPQGTTPASLDLPTGQHTVRVERAGYKPVERVVQVKLNEVALVRVELAAPSR